MLDAVADVREEFDVTVGSYPAIEDRNRLKVTGTDPDAVAAAADRLRERVEVVAEE